MAPGKPQLIVRNLEPEIVTALRERAARSGRSVEAEHRALLRETLRRRPRRQSLKEWLLRMPDAGTDADFERVRGRPRGVRF